MYDLVEVAPIPAVPLHDLFTYRVPETLRPRVHPGVRVRVPFGRGSRTGVVTGFTDTPPSAGLRMLSEVLDDHPFLTPDLLDLCIWTARYYLASLASVIATVVPTRMPDLPTERLLRLEQELDANTRADLTRRAPARARAYDLLHQAGGTMRRGDLLRAGASDAGLRGLVTSGLARADVGARPAPAPLPPLAPTQTISPTAEQRTAIGAIAGALARPETACFVLHGVTGSGKTEVYLQATAQALAADRDVLMLVPEIALTHQLVERTRARFGDLVAVLHSGLGPAERWAEWRRIRSRTARVVVGARSAVFAPVGALGLVVVDEEHDGAYKQEDGIRYHARDLAVVRARRARAVVVLGSATPSCESYQAALDGRACLLSLGERPQARPLPRVEIVDLRGRVHHVDKAEVVSPELREAIETTLAERGQTLVFLNRRGFARHLQCPACGEVVSCPQCSVTLTWHRAARALTCHHCHYRRPVGEGCDACGGPPLEGFGVGTEQVEAILAATFPGARVARLDRDAAARRGEQRRILARWHAGDIDILVGTQMVSKGHDVPGVTLVAVLVADLALNVPDFRASERTMQLLVQVAGRAGRGSDPGRVVIQTFRPSHPSIVAAQTHDYRTFIDGELARRRALAYPPFTRVVGVRLDAADSGRVERASQELARRLRAQAGELGLDPSAVLGPAPPPIERIRNRWRRHVLLRAADPRALRAIARCAREHARPFDRQGVRVVVDVDSYSM